MSVSPAHALRALVAYCFCLGFTGSLKAGKIAAPRGQSGPAACTGTDLLHHLPKPASVLRTISGGDGLAKDRHNFTSCAVVGNSGMLQATRYGEVIDSHSVVIRLNQAPSEGYQLHVGGRATYRIINKEWVRSYTKDTKWLPREEGLSLISRGDGEIRVSRGKFTCAVCMEPFKKEAAKWSAKRRIPLLKFSSATLAHSWRMVSTYALCSPVRTKKCPTCKASSGLLAVTMALSLCGHVSVYGMAGTRMSGEHPYHYYKFKGTELKKGYSGHMFEVERELVNQLGRDGFLTMCGVEDAVTCGAPSWRQSPCCQRELSPARQPDQIPEAHGQAFQDRPVLLPISARPSVSGEAAETPPANFSVASPSSAQPIPELHVGRSVAGVLVERFRSLYGSVGDKGRQPVDKQGGSLEQDAVEVPEVTKAPW